MHKCYYFTSPWQQPWKKLHSKKTSSKLCVFFYSSITSCYFLCDHTIIFLFNSKRDFTLHTFANCSVYWHCLSPKKKRFNMIVWSTSLFFVHGGSLLKNFTFIFKIMWKKRNIVAFGPMVKRNSTSGESMVLDDVAAFVFYIFGNSRNAWTTIM